MMTSADPKLPARADAVNVARVLHGTRVEGPGERFALWVQGCPLRCDQCCNPDLLPFRLVQWWSISDLLAAALAPPPVEGITILGGEPFSQAQALGTFAREVQAAGRGVIVYTGYPYAAIDDAVLAGAGHFLRHIDLLIDGPFLPRRASNQRRFIGSDNQVCHFLSPRYLPMKDTWPAGDAGLELRFDGQHLLCNGSPALVRAWKDRASTP